MDDWSLKTCDPCEQPTFAIGDTVERINVHDLVNGVGYLGTVEDVSSEGLVVRVTESSDPDLCIPGRLAVAPFTAYGKPCWRKVEQRMGSCGIHTEDEAQHSIRHELCDYAWPERAEEVHD